MQFKFALTYFIITFFITSCSIKYQDNSYGVKIIEEKSRVIVNSYSTLNEPNAVELAPFVVYNKNNDFFKVTVINSNASCNESDLDKMRVFFDKITNNKPSLITLKHAININLLPLSRFNNKIALQKGQEVIDFYFPFVKCDDLDRLNTIYYLMIHELKHVDLILTEEAKDISVIDNEYIATKSSNCTLITNKYFDSIEVFEVNDADLNDLSAYGENNIGNPSQLGAMKFHYEASKVAGVGVIKRETEQYNNLVSWCNE